MGPPTPPTPPTPAPTAAPMKPKVANFFDVLSRLEKSKIGQLDNLDKDDSKWQTEYVKVIGSKGFNNGYTKYATCHTQRKIAQCNSQGWQTDTAFDAQQKMVDLLRFNLLFESSPELLE